jgi:hypothetical protein
MAKPVTQRTGKYLYAVVPIAQEERHYGPIGIDGGEVYTIADGRVSAVVSDVPNAKIRPERRQLAAHHQVLKRLASEGAVLPVVFGIIADGPKALTRILDMHQTALVEQLKRVEGKVEMGLRVTWDVPNIFEFFVNTHEELRVLRDQVFHRGSEVSQEDKIELGRLFDRLLGEDRAAHTATVIEVLHPHCVEIKENKPRTEREVMNLACLVRQHIQKQFEEAVFEAAKLFDNNYSFDFNGPWPPHNFVDVNLQV